MLSLIERLALMTPEDRADAMSRLSDDQVEGILRGEWWATARPEQLAPEGDWNVWLMQCGRGWGKTRSGAEWLADEIEANPEWDGAATEWAIIGQTYSEARDICLEGPSGFLKVLEHRGMVQDRDFQLNRGAMIVEFATGQKVYIMAAKDKDVGRGYNLAGAWLDEFGKWRYADVIWTESLGPALRMGKRPRAVVTTTPKPTVKQLSKWADRFKSGTGSVFITTGSTYDNRRHLSAAALEELASSYEGTRIGRQELHGELIAEVEGALWTAESVEAHRIPQDWWSVDDPQGSLRNWQTEQGFIVPVKARNWQTIVAVDPPGETAECGIVVAQAPERAEYGTDHAVVLADMTIQGRPEEWGKQVVRAFNEWNCKAVYVEKNQGGDMVRSTIHAVDSSVPVRKITAVLSKDARAEPVSVLYERGLVHHVGIHAKLEDQMLTWAPQEAKSPDRLDALVHAIRTLIPEKKYAPARYKAVTDRQIAR